MKYTYKVLSNTKDETEVEVTVDFAEFLTIKDEVFNDLSREVKIPGFRPGKGPKEVIEQKIGSKLLNESVSKLLPRPAIEIIEKEKFRPVTQVHYDVTKFDEKEGITYKFHFTNFPTIKLGDLSKVKVKKEVSETKPEEIDDVIKSIMRSSVKPELLEKYKIEKPEKEKKAIKPKDEDKKESKKEEKKEEIDFELNDELVKALGYQKEQNLDELRKAVKARLEDLRNNQAEEEYVSKLVKEIIEISDVSIPESFIKTEIENYENDFKYRLKNLNLDVETYLQTQGTTLEKKREEWKKMAEDKVATDVLLINISLEHNVAPTEENVQQEIEAITDDSLKAEYDTDKGREMIRTVLMRRNGLNKLKELVEKVKK